MSDVHEAFPLRHAYEVSCRVRARGLPGRCRAGFTPSPPAKAGGRDSWFPRSCPDPSAAGGCGRARPGVGRIRRGPPGARQPVTGGSTICSARPHSRVVRKQLLRAVHQCERPGLPHPHHMRSLTMSIRTRGVQTSRESSHASHCEGLVTKPFWRVAAAVRVAVGEAPPM